APPAPPGAQLRGAEGARLLHRCQREQLQQVVLDHVPGGADAGVVAGAGAEADVLGHGDLHVVDEVGVPDRFVQLVREAQREDVCHLLLAQVVVDAEDVLGRKTFSTTSLSSRAEVRSCPKGFSITARRQEPLSAELSPESASCESTLGKASGGIER